MREKPFVPEGLSPKIDAASDAISPRELFQKSMAKMTPDELFRFMSALLGIPSLPVKSQYESDRPENKEFMEFVADENEKLGNNAEPIQPEDCDCEYTFEDLDAEGGHDE